MGGQLRRVLAASALYCVVEYAYWTAVLIVAFEQGGATLAAVVLLAQLLPAALLTPFLGAVGDRLPSSFALSIVYAVEGALLLALTWLLAVDAPLGAVVAASAVVTIVVSVARPLHYAALPQLAATPTALVRANAASGLFDGLGVFIGPAFAGIVIEGFGPAAVGAACVAAMIIAAGLVLGLGLGSPEGSSGDNVGGALDGLKRVRGDRAVLVLLLLLGLTYVITGSFEILGVAFATDVLNSEGTATGLMIGAAGLGAVLGAAAAAGLASRRRLIPAIIATLAGASLPLLVMAGTGSLVPAVFLLALCGFGISFASVAARTLLQRTTEPTLLARVFSVQEGILLLGLALGAVIGPPLVDGLGAAQAYLPVGLALLVLTVLAWPLVRVLDARAIFRPDVVALLRRVPFLMSMPPPALDRLSQGAQWLDVNDGTTVIEQGAVGDAFYVVDEGTLSVTVDGVLREHTLGAGDGFGEIALLHDVPRTATIIAVAPTRLLRIERDEFLAAVTGSPDGHQVAQSIAAARLELDSRSS